MRDLGHKPDNLVRRNDIWEALDDRSLRRTNLVSSSVFICGYWFGRFVVSDSVHLTLQYTQSPQLFFRTHPFLRLRNSRPERTTSVKGDSSRIIDLSSNILVLRDNIGSERWLERFPSNDSLLGGTSVINGSLLADSLCLFCCRGYLTTALIWNTHQKLLRWRYFWSIGISINIQAIFDTRASLAVDQIG